ncbi:MAG: hypothetical protein A3G27_07545 [Betaproteobacteria bacterium RIFCSPLOWO2_12_FULL_66_14]|nr:MAG: hypothetical protein A3G27_07545 [Betaproteobacteria bacterium RIFCSPLOWO2_12_FULL_66_14]
MGEDSDNYYCRNKARYEGSDAQFAGTHFCIAKRTLAADQKAIRAMGFAIDTERFEMFGNVAREQKAELEQKLFDALLDGGLEATGMMVNSAASLNPWNVNNAVNMLRSKGFGNQTVIAALRRVAAQKNKAAMATAYHQFVEVAKAAKEGWSTGSAIASDPRNAELRLLLGALKVMQGNPELGLVVTGAEVGESLAYLVYLNGRVGELSSMTDEKLSRLSTLGKRLKDHVDAMRTSRTAWRQAMGINSGDPTCRS